MESSGKIKGQNKKGRTISGLEEARAAFDGYRNNDQSAEITVDTKAHKGGPSMIGNLFQTIFLRNTATSIFSYHLVTTHRSLKMYPLFIRIFFSSFMN